MPLHFLSDDLDTVSPGYFRQTPAFLKLQRLGNKVVRTIGKSSRLEPTHESQNQQNHDARHTGPGETQQMKYKRLKLCGN